MCIRDSIGGAVGYVGWEKLTTDKSVVHIVSDAVIGKSATDTLADACILYTSARILPPGLYVSKTNNWKRL